MDESQHLSVFKAQTENVRELKTAWAHVNRQINGSLLQGDAVATGIQTKVLALIYCAIAEAGFSKMIHIPHGLTCDEIEQIKKCTKTDGIKSGWIKCAELAIRRVDGDSSNYSPNILRKLSELIQEFIYDPSLLRNKLAHGQWSIALNRENTAVNREITQEIKSCTVIDLYRRAHSLKHLSAIIEDMIESPNRAHRRDFGCISQTSKRGYVRSLGGHWSERSNNCGERRVSKSYDPDGFRMLFSS
jgi:hypothetical protein